MLQAKRTGKPARDKASTLQDDRKTSTATAGAQKVSKKSSAADAEKLGNVAASLRKAYQDTVEENVPDSMMDLLRRLS